MAVSGRKDKQKLSSTLSKGCAEDYEIFCQPCDRDDIRLPAFGFCNDCAEHLCESCFNHHKRPKPLRHHTLLDKHNMPQTLQVPSQSVHTNQSNDLTRPCPEHKKEMLKFYCHDHKTLLCSVCVTLDHPKTSCKVNYIPGISKQSLNSKEYTNTLKELDKITEQCKKTTAVLKEKITSSNKSSMDVLADIKKFRQEINQKLDKLEKEAENKTKSLQKENDTRLKAAETTCHDVIKSLTVSSDAIKQLNTSKQADKLFMEMKSAEKLIADHKKSLSHLASPVDVKEYTFQPNQAITSCLQKETSLGMLTTKTPKSTSPPAAAVRSPQFSYQDDICVETTKDEDNCWITGMVLLNPSKLIITDCRNQSIKLVDLNTNSITDQLQLQDKPGDITSVTSDKVAVTLIQKQTIQFISTSSNKLSLKHKLKVDGKCRGISCYQKKLVVTFEFPGKLQIVDLKGKVLITVTKDQSGEDIFSLPYYVTSNSHSIYVSDEAQRSVIRLNWQGELIASYGGMGVPTGLTMLEDGSILVCDWGNNNIHHISADLTKGKVVLKDVKKPYAICWCGTNSKLYMSHTTGDEKYGNFIKIFKMS